MTGDSCNLASKETRSVLCDMTNLPSKRGISSILGDLLLKSGDESGKTVARESSGVKFSKRLCLVVDDLVKESSRTSDTIEGSSSDDKNSSGDSPVNGGSNRLKLVDGQESQEATDIIGNSVDAAMDDDCLKESCISIKPVQICSELDQKDYKEDTNVSVIANQSNATDQDLTKSVFSSSNSEIKTSEEHELPNSKTIEAFTLNRCSNADTAGIINHDMEADELKSCSCSFCLKAAYIWSDLHYQDIKGRLSVLKKSQKEANNLIQRNSRRMPMEIHGSTNSNNSAKLEFDLMGQWTSLFLNMEGILAREGTHLQNSFVGMKELRENCKMDLERSMESPQHKN